MSITEQEPKASPQQPPRIGEYWPGEGGFYAGIIRDTETNQQWHLIVADIEVRGEFGNYGKEIEGANSYTNGHANTQALLAAGSDIAIKAANHNADGHTDFYVAAQKEQNVGYANLSDKYSKEWHWSSTQYSAVNAWLQHFEYGDQDVGSKSNAYAVRPVRRLLIE